MIDHFPKRPELESPYATFSTILNLPPQHAHISKSNRAASKLKKTHKKQISRFPIQPNSFLTDSFFDECAQMYSLVKQNQPRPPINAELSSNNFRASSDFGKVPNHISPAEVSLRKTSRILLQKRPQMPSPSLLLEEQGFASDSQAHNWFKLLQETLILDQVELGLLEQYEKTHSDYLKALSNPTRLDRLEQEFGNFYSTFDSINRKLKLELPDLDGVNVQISQQSKPMSPLPKYGFDRKEHFKKTHEHKNSLWKFKTETPPKQTRHNLPIAIREAPKSQPRTHRNRAIRQSAITGSMTVVNQEALGNHPQSKSILKAVSVPASPSKPAKTERTLVQEQEQRLFSVDPSKWVFFADSKSNHYTPDLNWGSTDSPKTHSPSDSPLLQIAHLVWFEQHVPAHLVRRLDSGQR